MALHLVRIAQEGTINALKYAGATQVSVKLAVHKKDLQLTILDNGHGFDATKAGVGYGLSNMHKRTEEAKGSFNLRTGPSGTYIRVTLPLNA